MMVNILIPMAGLGSRFSNAGYSTPKPLIKLNGKHMIEGVIKNLRPSNVDYKFIFICQDAHLKKYNFEEKILSIEPNSEIISINYVTEGAACTALVAEKFINNNDRLMIANSDQWVDINIDKYLSYENHNKLDGLIMTMRANEDKWSYVSLGQDKLVDLVVEKEVISNEATVGIYNFKKGSDFCFYANKMIENNDRVNGEFYVAPVYNALIKDDKKIGIFNIGSVNNGMYGIGTPDDLEEFIENPISKNF